jgi:ATP-dependent Clp protease protease subunit
MKKMPSLDAIDLWLNSGIDFDNRVIDFAGEVNERKVSLVNRALIKMAQINNKQPITLFISSFGGSVYDAISLYDTITTLSCPVTTFGDGKVISSGFIIFLAGTKRLSYPSTTYMMHSISGGTEGRAIDLEIDALESKRLNKLILDIIVSKTNKPKSYWYRVLRYTDYYMDFSKAREYNVITHTLEESQNEQKRKTKKRTVSRNKK